MPVKNMYIVRSGEYFITLFETYEERWFTTNHIVGHVNEITAEDANQFFEASKEEKEA